MAEMLAYQRQIRNFLLFNDEVAFRRTGKGSLALRSRVFPVCHTFEIQLGGSRCASTVGIGDGP